MRFANCELEGRQGGPIRLNLGVLGHLLPMFATACNEAMHLSNISSGFLRITEPGTVLYRLIAMNN